MSYDGDELNNNNHEQDDGNLDPSAQGRRRQPGYNSMIRRWDREGDKPALNGLSRMMQECRGEE